MAKGRTDRNPDRLAGIVADSIARHQSRGLVDGAAGMDDVVIHGRVNLAEVAADLFAATLAEMKPVRRSWSAWFVAGVEQRGRERRRDRRRERLAERLETAPTPVAEALTRLRIRELK